MTEAANEFVANMIDRSVFTPNELALCNRIQELEAALAQKTRECEALRRCESPDPLECDNTNNHPHACHCNDPAYWKQKSDSLKAQVEQLERQVAELKWMI